MNDPKPAKSPSPARHAWKTSTVVVSLLLGVSLHGDDLLYERFGEYRGFAPRAAGNWNSRAGGRHRGHQRHRLGTRIRQAGPEPVPAGPDGHAVSHRRRHADVHCGDGAAMRRGRTVVPQRPRRPVRTEQSRRQRHSSPIADPLVGNVWRPGLFIPPGTPRAVVDCRERVQCRFVPQENGEPAGQLRHARLGPGPRHHSLGAASPRHPTPDAVERYTRTLERLASPLLGGHAGARDTVAVHGDHADARNRPDLHRSGCRSLRPGT